MKSLTFGRDRAARAGLGLVTFAALFTASLAACGLEVTGGVASDERDAATGSFDASAEPLTEEAGIEAGLTDANVDANDGALPGDAGLTIGTTTVGFGSLTFDRTKPADGPIASDFAGDGIFDVTISGSLVALALVRTDKDGDPEGGQQWDTWVGTDTIPSAVGAGFALGKDTYQLAAVEGIIGINDGDGRLTLDGKHDLHLYASDVGEFKEGRFFRVVAESPSHVLVWGPVCEY